MIKKAIFSLCLLIGLVWMAGGCCAKPVAVAAPPPPPPPVVAPAPEAPPPYVAPAPQPMEQPTPSKKLKKRVVQPTEE